MPQSKTVSSETGATEESLPTICSLPVELYFCIFGFVLYNPHYGWIYPTNHRREYKKTFKHSKAELISQQATPNLFLTSKAMAEIVETHLYSSIIIASGRSLANLSALLKKNLHVGQLVHRLDCRVDLTSQSLIKEWYLFHHEYQHGKGMGDVINPGDLPGLLPVHTPSASKKRKNKDSKAKAKEKAKTTKWAHPVATKWWAGRMDRSRSRSIVHVFIDILSRTAVRDLHCLLELKCLGIQCDSYRAHDPDVLQWPSLFPQLEILDASTIFSHEHTTGLAGKPEGKMPRLKHLRLYNVSIPDHRLMGLRAACPGLQTLVISRYSVKGSDEATAKKVFKEVLFETTPSLRYLQLLSS